MSVIAGYAELLADGLAGELSPEQLEFVVKIQESVARLDRTIMDLAEVGNVRLCTGWSERVDVHSVIDALVLARRGDFEVKGVAVAATVEPAAQRLLVARDALTRGVGRLFDHILSGAPSGALVALKVRALGAIVQIEVDDPGLAISTEDVECAFDYLHSSGRARSHSEPGGSNLTVCRAWIESCGGSVRAIQLARGKTTYRIELTAEVVA